MKHLIRILTFLLLSVCIATGCKSQRKHNILVLHAYPEKSYKITGYDEALSKSLDKNGIEADIRNVYETGHFTSENIRTGFIDDLMALKASGWAPDIICIEEDRTLDDYLDGLYDSLIISNGAMSVPVVAAGQHCPDWDALKKRNDIAILLDEIDIEKNVDLATEISGKEKILTQLGYDDYALRLREKLSGFQNISAVSLKENAPKDSSCHDRNLSPEEIFLKTEEMVTLTFCRDLFDEELANASRGMTFTAIRDAFLQGRTKRLCGYFASYRTVAMDQGIYAAKILKGAAPADLQVKRHKQDYYMDLDAMKAYNIHPLKWEGKFEIVRAPFNKKQPLILILVILTLFGLTILHASHFISQREKYEDQKMTEQIIRLKTELEMFKLGLLGSGCKFLDSMSDVRELEKITHPDDIGLLSDLIHSIEQKEWTTDTCVRLTNDKGKTYRWWQVRTYNDEETDTFSAGIAIDIDDSIRHTEEMMNMEKVAKEVTKKESFMRNLSHEIRTPLNTIVGFSEFISDNFDEISDEEKEEFGTEISKSTKALEQMLEVVLQYSRFESGRVKFNCKDCDMGKLVEEIFVEWRMDNDKSGVEVRIQRGRPDIIACVDPDRTKEILRQFLRNALKFTDNGTITIGWSLDSSNSQVSLYVSDTGRGIEVKKQKFVFDLFWKEDPFTQGLGLGLSLAKMYTEKMNGHVSMQSNFGEGSIFVVSFPCRLD